MESEKGRAKGMYIRLGLYMFGWAALFIVLAVIAMHDSGSRYH
jgi:hypothetical protein